jgi:hypothetical protein
MRANSALARQETLDVQAFIAFLAVKPDAHRGAKTESRRTAAALAGGRGNSVHYIDCGRQSEITGRVLPRFPSPRPLNGSIVRPMPAISRRSFNRAPTGIAGVEFGAEPAFGTPFVPRFPLGRG